ncbi:hypothetical protein NMG60_11007298 [Bertholletia excelsa]
MVSFNFWGQLVFVCLLSLSPKVSLIPIPVMCDESSATSTPDNPYKNNVKSLLIRLFPIAYKSTGYYSVVGADTPDAVYGLFLCRGDVPADDCGKCVVEASSQIEERCPGSKVAISWFDDCLLRYSNSTDSPFYYRGVDINKQIIPDVERYSTALLGLMQDLAQAMPNQSSKRFVTKQVNLTAVSTLYGLQQCIPNISTADCNMCLRDAISLLQGCCLRSRSARILLDSCIVWFDIKPFYNSTTPPLPPPPPPTSSG